MVRQRATTKRFMFERSFDDPNRLYLPGEKRKAELAAERAAVAAADTSKTEANGPSNGQPAKSPAPETKEEPDEIAPPEPMFSKAELDAAREDGHIAGHAAALEEAETAREHYIADAIALIGQGLEQIGEQQQAANKDAGETAMRLVVAILHKLLPSYAVAHASENINAFVQQVLPVVLGEPKLVIRVHNLIVKDVESRIRETFERAGFQGGFTVVADYELQPGDCRVEWAGGGADRSEARIWDEVRDIISANFGEVDFEQLDRAADEDKSTREANSDAATSAADVAEPKAAAPAEIPAQSEQQDSTAVVADA